jgi:hypothetical protein
MLFILSPVLVFELLRFPIGNSTYRESYDDELMALYTCLCFRRLYCEYY